MPLARISITIPEELVAQADRKAAGLDRSRSWVLVEALRRYLTAPEALVRERPVEYAPGLGSSRAAQLAADLRLSPEERVLAAERTLLVDAERGPVPLRNRLLTFDRYEDFLEWERREAVRR